MATRLTSSGVTARLLFVLDLEVGRVSLVPGRVSELGGLAQVRLQAVEELQLLRGERRLDLLRGGPFRLEALDDRVDVRSSAVSVPFGLGLIVMANCPTSSAVIWNALIDAAACFS